MQEFIYKTEEELLKRANEAIGKTFSEIENGSRLATKKNKGRIGQMFEESWFGIDVNSRAEADFKDLDIELKVTPFIYNKSNKRTSKERLVLNIINYMEEYKNSFEESSFWTKNQKILMMFYEHIKETSKDNYKVEKVLLYEYPDEDLIIIKQDWEKIVNKIKNGQAHELSEGDTLYLGACTKGSTAAKSFREQPFSKEKAKQRAFSLKQSYMTHILNEYAFGKKPQTEKLIKDINELSSKGFEDYLIDKFKPHFGKTQKELLEEFDLKDSKGVNYLIAARILGLKGGISSTEEFQKANIEAKTIRINKSNTSIKENMSFKHFDFKELVKETWEESHIYNLLSQKRFFFIIFKFDEKNILRLHDIMFWNLPNDDLEEVHKVWKKTIKVVESGKIIKNIKTTKSGEIIRENYFPKQSENRVSHIRPHGADASDENELPNGESYTKQCFWLNNSYVLEQILLHTKS